MMIAHRRIAGSIAAPALSADLQSRPIPANQKGWTRYVGLSTCLRIVPLAIEPEFWLPGPALFI
jgi:hypothetical protein